MARNPKPADPNAPPRIVKPRKLFFMYEIVDGKLANHEVVGDAGLALDKKDANPNLNYVRFELPRSARPRKPKDA